MVTQTCNLESLIDIHVLFSSLPEEVDLMLQKEGLSLSDVEDAPIDSL